MTELEMVLFSTDHCRLCEDALELVLSMPELAGKPLRVVDVASDEALLAAYGERLPVLHIAGRELDWPFDSAAIADLLV